MFTHSEDHHQLDGRAARGVAELQTGGHAFISYVREDAEHVDRLQKILEAAGVRVWRDTDDLWPGQDWRIEIRQAIQNDSLAFLACFSGNTAAREASYQNEELVLASEQMRQRPPGRVWLIPIRFSDCSVPDFDLGAGRCLGSIQRVDLFGDNWDRGAGRLVSAVLGVLASRTSILASPVVLKESAIRPKRDILKDILLDPNRQIELEDLVNETIKDTRARLLDEGEFPVASPELTRGPSGIRYLVHQAHRYEEVVQPLMEVLSLGCAWSRASHESLWARAIQSIANSKRRSGGQTALLDLQSYPLLLAMYGAGIAAVHRENYGALRAIAMDARARNDHNSVPAIGAMHAWMPFHNAVSVAQVLAFEHGNLVVDDEFIKSIESGRQGRRLTPVSDHLATLLEKVYIDHVMDDGDFLEVFDNLEILLGVIASDAYLREKGRGVYVQGPWAGSFTWRSRYSNSYPEVRMRSELDESGDDWKPLKSGLFGGSVDRAVLAFDHFVEFTRNVRSRHF